ncbi:hypothetical protein D3C78_1323300 [compost metagenome]
MIHRRIEQLELDRAVGLADHIPEIFPVDLLGLDNRQVLDIQMRVGVGGDAELGALELAPALLATRPVAVVLGVVRELALMADQPVKCFVKVHCAPPVQSCRSPDLRAGVSC